MKFTFIYLILTACLLAACQKEVDHETVYEPYSGSPTTTHGTIDSGGGNGSDGKPLESFRIDPEQWETKYPEFAKVITNLAKVNPGLAGNFLHIIKHRGWYEAPVPLAKISSIQLGVPFTTSQYAIQSRQEIWFDQNLFEGSDPNALKTDDDRVQLIVHELVMGLRVLEHATTEDQCEASATKDLLPPSPNKSKFDGERNKCHDLYGAAALLPQPDFTLVDRDYAQIRDLASHLFLSRDEMSASDIDSWLTSDQLKVW